MRNKHEPKQTTALDWYFIFLLATIYTILPTTNRYKARLVLSYRAKLNFDREISFPKTHFQAIYLETFSERFLEKKSKLDISLLIKFTLERQF